jgi:hypothetical protein
VKYWSWAEYELILACGRKSYVVLELAINVIKAEL